MGDGGLEGGPGAEGGGYACLEGGVGIGGGGVVVGAHVCFVESSGCSAAILCYELCFVAVCLLLFFGDGWLSAMVEGALSDINSDSRKRFLLSELVLKTTSSTSKKREPTKLEANHIY